MNYMDIPNPVVIGDTVTAEFEVTEKRDLESQDDQGLVTIDSHMTSQDDEVVFAGDMKFLFKNGVLIPPEADSSIVSHESCSCLRCARIDPIFG